MEYSSNSCCFLGGGNKLLSREELDLLSKIDISSIDKSELQEIGALEIDKNLPVTERFKLFMDKVKNPYCFLVNGTPVSVSFANPNRTLEEALKSYLTNLKNLDE